MNGLTFAHTSCCCLPLGGSRLMTSSLHVNECEDALISLTGPVNLSFLLKHDSCKANLTANNYYKALIACLLFYQPLKRNFLCGIFASGLGTLCSYPPHLLCYALMLFKSSYYATKLHLLASGMCWKASQVLY